MMKIGKEDLSLCALKVPAVICALKIIAFLEMKPQLRWKLNANGIALNSQLAFMNLPR